MHSAYGRKVTDSRERVDSAAGWLVVAATATATFAVFGVTYSFGAVFTAIREEFGVGKGQAALFFSFTTFIYFVVGVFTGRLADRYGPRPIFACRRCISRSRAFLNIIGEQRPPRLSDIWRRGRHWSRMRLRSNDCDRRWLV